MKKSVSIKRNVILNIVRQCCNIIFPLITYPYVSRILMAENFGRYSFADSVVTLAMTAAGLGIGTYGLREGAKIRDDKDKIKTFSNEIFSINVFAMLIVYTGLFVLLVCNKRLNRDVLLIGILSINIATSVIGREWVNQIYEDFLYITIRYIAFQILAIILIFTLIKNTDDYVEYTVIMLIANSGGYITNFFYTQKYIPLRYTFQCNLKKHIKPIIYLAGVNLAVQIYIRSDITLLGFLRSDREVGIYSIISKIYTIIKALLNAVIVVMLPRLSNYEGKNNAAYEHLLSQLMNCLIYLIFPCVTGLFFLSEDILFLVGGNEYLCGKITLQILCLALVFAVLACFYTNGILVVKRKDNGFFVATVISAVLNILLNWILIPHMGMNGAALTTVIAEFFVVIISIICASKEEISIGIVNFKSVFVGCLGIGLICCLMNLMINSFTWRIFFSMIVSVVVYFGITYLLKNAISLKVVEFITRYITW